MPGLQECKNCSIDNELEAGRELTNRDKSIIKFNEKKIIKYEAHDSGRGLQKSMAIQQLPKPGDSELPVFEGKQVKRLGLVMVRKR